MNSNLRHYNEAPKAANLKDVCMHLTNYAVNKTNENFKFNEDAEAGDEGSKWSIQGLKDWMAANGHDFDAMWALITDLIVKTIISIQPVLAHNYHSVLPPENNGYSCFEILGLDVMMDDKLRPWLIEVNHSPSFTVDTPLDLAIKEDLISDTFELLRMDPKAIKKAQAEEKAEAQTRLWGGGGGGAGASAGGGGASGGGVAGGAGVPPPGVHGKAMARPTREELEERRREGAAEVEERRREGVATRVRWEEKHSGSFDIAYPAAEPAKQALYERLLAGAREVFDKHSLHSRVRDTLEREKAKAARKASEEEHKAAAAKSGLRAPAGAKLRRAVDASMGPGGGGGTGAGGGGGRSTAPGAWGVGHAGGGGGGKTGLRPGSRRGSEGGSEDGEDGSEDGDGGEGGFGRGGGGGPRLYYPSEMLGLARPGAMPRSRARSRSGTHSATSSPLRGPLPPAIQAAIAKSAAAAVAAAAAAAEADGTAPLGSPPKYGRRAAGAGAEGSAEAYLDAAAAYHRQHYNSDGAAGSGSGGGGGGGGGGAGGGRGGPPYAATMEAMMARLGGDGGGGGGALGAVEGDSAYRQRPEAGPATSLRIPRRCITCVCNPISSSSTALTSSVMSTTPTRGLHLSTFWRITAQATPKSGRV